MLLVVLATMNTTTPQVPPTAVMGGQTEATMLRPHIVHRLLYLFHYFTIFETHKKRRARYFGQLSAIFNGITQETNDEP